MLRDFYFLLTFLSCFSELATTAPATTAPLTALWTRWTTGISRTIPSPGSGITWRHAAGGARTTRGAGGNSPVRPWWRRSRRPRGGWSPVLSCCSLTCTRRWRLAWTSRENPCGGTCSSTKSTTLLTCTTNNLMCDGRNYDLLNKSGSGWGLTLAGIKCCTANTVLTKRVLMCHSAQKRSKHFISEGF